MSGKETVCSTRPNFPSVNPSVWNFSCRFLFGGEHGRLRFPPPYGFSPLYECLLPTQTLALDPCFHFGDLTKSSLAGPLEVLNDTAFVPQPVDTTMVLHELTIFFTRGLNNKAFLKCLVDHLADLH